MKVLYIGSFDTNIPWFMCQQNGLDSLILTCNGFYCHDWIQNHWKSYFNTPAMFTGMHFMHRFCKYVRIMVRMVSIMGLCTSYKVSLTLINTCNSYRPSSDVAFSTTAWVARGGGYISYYMWHGGTNFGPWGSDWKITSYDYDAPLNEYGFPSQPKYSHLRQLHNVLWFFADVILNRDPIVRSLGPNVESITYKDDNNQGVLFLINSNETHGYKYLTRGMQLYIPEWTIMIMTLEPNGQLSTVFSTSSQNIQEPMTRHPSASNIQMGPYDISFIVEPKGIWHETKVILSEYPLEQIRTSQDASSYFWYSNSDIQVPLKGNLTLEFTHATDFVYIFLNDHLMNPQGTFRIKAGTDTEYKKPESIQLVIPEKDIQSISSQSTLENQINLSILSVNMGNVNYGAHFDDVKKGIYSQLYLNGMDVTKGHWRHLIGLQGELQEYFNVKSHHPWSRVNVPFSTPFVWYRLTFQISTIQSMISEAKSKPQNCELNECDDGSFLSFSLHLGSMGKGHAFVNGHSIGRYWDIKSDPDCLDMCNPGYYSPDYCLKDCGKPSQEYYHVPANWILEQQEIVEIVLFEEKGGDPTQVKLLLIN